MNISYHFCHEQVAVNILTPIKVHIGDNIADTATKPLEGSTLQHINKILFPLPFYMEHQIQLVRITIWHETLNKT